MSLFRSFLSRPRQERATIVRSVTAVLVVKPLLAWRGYRTTVGLLSRFAPSPSEATLEEIRGRARLGQRVMSRMPLDLTCLERSLVVWWLIGAEPHAEIRFGVQPNEDTAPPRFHAWVEIDGETLDDGTEDPSRYLPLTRPESLRLEGFD